MKDNITKGYIMKNIIKQILILGLILTSVDASDDKRYSSSKAAVASNDFLTESALHDAVRANDLELVQFLMKQNAEVNKQDSYGYTPLHLAVRLHSFEITEYLISKGANLNTNDTYKDTPLLDSTRNNDTKISEVLICNGAYRNVSDAHQMSTLNNSSKNNNRYISKLLRADTVEPYCQDEIKISIMSIGDKEICGTIDKGYVVNLSVNVEDKNEEDYGNAIAKVNNSDKTWCAPFDKTKLMPMDYIVNAKATDYVVNQALATKDMTVNDKLNIDITDVNSTVDNTPLVCGNILSGNADKLDILLVDVNNSSSIYGKYNSIINKDEKMWCANVEDELPNGTYKILATGYDGNETAIDDSVLNINNIVVPDINISITDINETVGNKPKICGKILAGDVIRTEVMLSSDENKTYGLYNAKINQEEQTWCTKVLDELPNGKYDVIANGYDENNNTAQDTSKINVYVIPGLYEALMTEFYDDFEPWGAELDKDTLTFRFKNPTVLFKSAKKDLRIKFKTILDNFYPRYIKILKDYRSEIDKVVVEGHSSSEHSRGRTIETKFELNRVLSQNRAEEVLNYVSSLKDEIVIENTSWTIDTFKAHGFSSSRLVYNEDYTENRELSRRVELSIKTNKQELIDGEISNEK